MERETVAVAAPVVSGGVNFMKSDITEMIGIKGIEEKELASAHCSSTLRLKKSGLTVGDVRGILRDFEAWGAEVK
jgi:hypothetical protein